MSSSPKPDHSIPPVNGNSPNEIVSDESPKPGISKKKTAAVAGGTSLVAAICAAVGTHSFCGGTPAETAAQCVHSNVCQVSRLIFEADVEGRREALGLDLPPSTPAIQANDERTPLQRSCDQFNDELARHAQDPIGYAANLPEDSPARYAPTATRIAADTFRKRNVGGHGRITSRRADNNDPHGADGRPQRLLRKKPRGSKLHRSGSRLFNRK